MSITARPQDASAGSSLVAGAALAVLEQCETFVRCMTDGVYTADSAVIRGGTAGKHVRHTLDHFSAVLTGTLGATIDYDHRERDVPMESNRGAALAAITVIRAEITRLGEDELARSVRVRVMIGEGGEEADVASTLARELAFAAHHAVHHHAMLKAIAQEFGTILPAAFGKAPSTIHHERTLRH